MQAIFSVTLPFFALVLCGYLAARARLLPEAAIPGLNAYVLFFALPCMLFRFGAGTPLAQLLNPVWLALYASCALLMVAVTVVASLGSGLRLKDAAFGALVAAFPNTGFMGVPLLVALLGERAAGPVIMTVLVDLFLTSSLCLALAQSEGAGHLREGLLKAVRGALGNPLPWAITLGAVMSVTQLSLPGPLAQIIRMLADSATPVALFTIGAVLWRANQAAHARTPWRHVAPAVSIKLLLHPALVLAGGHLLGAAGLPLDAFALSVLVLAAALPSASNVSLLAERYGADNGRVARIILWSTVLAFLTFSLAVRLAGVQPA
ncbi:AEC family transporter [Aquabacterium sp. A7-Y]|uniref:AEC family transporter n=1 Tax=Aquabacterium sp. A7-Y TaxID=1349605 RepID=UPI00223D1888|nr:AEC family transporter [Aquabacterium sp. A7-Y]MCW7539532.1 AEC family transporter [Aquabacterium sp. A7-Y]